MRRLRSRMVNVQYLAVRSKELTLKREMELLATFESISDQRACSQLFITSSMYLRYGLVFEGEAILLVQGINAHLSSYRNMGQHGHIRMFIPRIAIANLLYPSLHVPHISIISVRPASNLEILCNLHFTSTHAHHPSKIDHSDLSGGAVGS